MSPRAWFSGLLAAGAFACAIASPARADICEGGVMLLPLEKSEAERGLLSQAAAVTTEVLGLHAFEVGTPIVHFGGTPVFDNDEVDVARTEAVGLLWQFANAPDAGATWRQVFQAPEGQATFDVSFQFDAASNLGCVRVVLNGGQAQTLCTPGAHGFLMLTFVTTRCTQVGDWNASLTGPDPGASFFRPYRVTPSGVTLRMFQATEIQTHLPAENVVGAPAPEVPGGVGRVLVFAVDSLCTDTPLPDRRVRIQARFRDATGGHLHQTSPDLDATSVGRILPTVVPFQGTQWNPAAGGVFETTTGRGGFAGGDVTAGQASLILDWLATAPATGDSTQGGMRLTARVPMIELTGSSFYHLDGGPGQACGDPTFCDRHEPNHFVVPPMAAALEDFARVFFVEISGFLLKVGLNDMSLPLGGVFDLNGNWRPSHHFHRRGIDCDVAFVYDLAGNARGFAGNQALKADIDEAARLVGLVKVPEPQLHYRLAP